VSEQIGVQLDRTYPNTSQFPTYTTGPVRYFEYNNQPAIEITGGEFIGDMSTGTITVSAPQNPTPTPNYTISTTPYISTIKKILSPTSALLDSNYTVYSSQSVFPHTYTQFDNSTFSLNYEASPTYVPTENSQSFALIQITGLEPATGDVSRIKVFTNNNGTVGTWDLVNDVELEETEIFISNTASLFPDQSIGIFTSQSIIDTYWQAHTFQNGIEITPTTLQFTTASMSNAMLISSSINIANSSSVQVAQISSSFNGVFKQDAFYKITLDAIGTRSVTSNNLQPKLAIYLSGSSFYQDPTDYFNQEFPTKFGKRIGEITAIGDAQRFDDQTFSFIADYTGTGVLLLVVETGEWQVSDIHVVTDNDAGYTPDYTRLKTPIQTTHKIDNQISFKVEYYNVAGVKSKQISYVYNLDWEGGNRYIDGNFSMLTGSLYVADSLNSGVAISGYPNSGFVRSLGYEGFYAGFPGFLLWSGSALPGQTTKGNVAYSGVGLELYANTASYFRYSTSPSEIDVRTDSFFFGNPATTFISGANGNVEISASGFHLTAQGNVTASSFLAVQGGNVLFDSNSEFVDGLNVGRIVYFDQSESVIDIGSIDGGATNAQTASVFQTYILPGETRCQVSFTYEIANTGSVSVTCNAQAYIATASLGPTVGSSYYGAFQDGGSIGNPFAIGNAVLSSTTESGAQTTEVTIGDDFADRQGMYSQIYLVVYTNATGTGGTLKMKNFVWRTSRSVGGSTITPLNPIK
jgi:hypothetical protein